MKLDIKEEHVRDAVYYLAFFSRRKRKLRKKSKLSSHVA